MVIMKTLLTFLFLMLPFVSLAQEGGTVTQSTPLNQDVKMDIDERVNKVFRDMVVVQRKAKNKARSFLFVPQLGLDFSDGPITLYTLNTNVGYALSDFWEIYLNYVPAFVTNERSIVKKISELKLANGDSASITYSRPKSQIGAEILYAPAYGKDSWGPYSIVRSDTFFKFGAAQITYDVGSGSRYWLMVGKTYFMHDYFNFRISVGSHYVQTIVDEKKEFNGIFVIESGLVFYL